MTHSAQHGDHHVQCHDGNGTVSCRLTSFDGRLQMLLITVQMATS